MCITWIWKAEGSVRLSSSTRKSTFLDLGAVVGYWYVSLPTDYWIQVRNWASLHTGSRLSGKRKYYSTIHQKQFMGFHGQTLLFALFSLPCISTTSPFHELTMGVFNLFTVPISALFYLALWHLFIGLLVFRCVRVCVGCFRWREAGRRFSMRFFLLFFFFFSVLFWFRYGW